MEINYRKMQMTLQVGNSYKIGLEINNAILTFTCRITEIDDPLFTFIDKFGEKYTYNKRLIISIKDCEDFNGN